ncbi:MAG: tyrosine-type recombinase/integrase [Verrucomicrobiales bacterium]|nr:tyrosine-type recombinase/integrase [Verrucomicrobiales bacterium]
MLLNDIRIRNAKGRGKVYRLRDGDGLFLVVRPNGRKFWQYRYRHLEKEKTVSFGSYPSVCLSDARKRKSEAKELIEKGKCPSQAKKVAKREAVFRDRNTFCVVAEEWHGRNTEIWSAVHGKKVWQRLNNPVLPYLGNRPIGDIEPLELLEVIQRIEAKGATHMAKRVLQFCSAIFKFAIVTGRAKQNIAAGLVVALRPHRTKNYPCLRESEIEGFLESFTKLATHQQNKNAFLLLLMTALRTGELRYGKWADIDWEKRQWLIPAGYTKMKRDHIVPLSDYSLAILHDQKKISGNGQWIFPNLQNRVHPVMSEGTILSLINRMGYKGQIVGHGFRSMFSTIMNENGFNRDAIERQLAHVESNMVRAAYNRAEYMQERREMMQWWSDFIESKLPDSEKIRSNESSNDNKSKAYHASQKFSVFWKIPTTTYNFVASETVIVD